MDADHRRRHRRHGQEAVGVEKLDVVLITAGRQEAPEDLLPLLLGGQDQGLAVIAPEIVNIAQNIGVDQVARRHRRHHRRRPQQGAALRADPVFPLFSQHAGQHRRHRQGRGADHQRADAGEPPQEGHQAQQAAPDRVFPPDPARRLLGGDPHIQPHRQKAQGHMRHVEIMIQDDPAVGHAEGQQQRRGGDEEHVQAHPGLLRQIAVGRDHQHLHDDRAPEPDQGPVRADPEQQGIDDLDVHDVQLRRVNKGGGENAALPGQLLAQQQARGSVGIQERCGNDPGRPEGGDQRRHKQREAQDPFDNRPDIVPPGGGQSRLGHGASSFRFMSGPLFPFVPVPRSLPRFSGFRSRRPAGSFRFRFRGPPSMF